MYGVMKKDLLLPNGFKKAGWVLLFTSLVMGAWAAWLDFDFSKSALLVSLQLATNSLLNNYIVIGLWLGVILVGCSRERVEDEMIGRIRLNALLAAFYFQALFIVVATLVCNSFDYLDIMIYNLVSYPLIFIVAYRWMLWRTLKMTGDEE